MVAHTCSSSVARKQRVVQRNQRVGIQRHMPSDLPSIRPCILQFPPLLRTASQAGDQDFTGACDGRSQPAQLGILSVMYSNKHSHPEVGPILLTASDLRLENLCLTDMPLTEKKKKLSFFILFCFEESQHFSFSLNILR